MQKRILFVCHGNICRSPMAEAVFNRIIEQNETTQDFRIDSAGIINYHEGELADSRMRFHASKRNYHLTHRSRPFKIKDFKDFDLIIGMDNENIDALKRKANTPKDLVKIHKMTDFCLKHQAFIIPDPYYGGDSGFEHVIDLLEDACAGLFKSLENYHNK
jgi:protein-tyrosine phosphatase